MNSLFRYAKNINTVYTKYIQTSPSLIRNGLIQKRFWSTKKYDLDLNTNVAKDVIMYQHDNSRFITILKVFAVSQYTFWSYLSYATYSGLRDVPVDVTKLKPDSPWYMKINLGEKKYKYAISASCGFIAVTTLLSVWSFTVRMVRYIVLHKGGTQVSFVTYSPVGPNRIHKVPLNHVSCFQSRSLAKAFIPIKVKKIKMNFLVDTRGTFRNPSLFDSTVGISRNVK